MPLREIPIEMWWNVIDELQDDQSALLACALVCRGWASRSMHLLGKPIRLRSPTEVLEIAKLGRTNSQEVKSCRKVEIRIGDSLRGLGLFAVMFARKMPRLKTLLVEVDSGTRWRPGEMPVDVFHYLSTFTSITRLSLHNVIFPSVQTFGRLVYALPSLTTLQCNWTEFDKHDYETGSFLRRPRNLTSLNLDYQNLATTHDISNFLVATEMASTLKEINSRSTIFLDTLDESGIPALVSSAGPSLHALYLMLDVHSEWPPLGEKPSVIDFSKVVNLKHVGFEIKSPYYEVSHDNSSLPGVMRWICDQLAALAPPSIALHDLTLALQLGTRPPSEDSAVRHQSYVQHCKLLDDTLSSLSFLGLEQFILEIHTCKLKTTDQAKLEQLAPTRFPKSAARGIFRVAVIDNLYDRWSVGEYCDFLGSYPITELELPA